MKKILGSVDRAVFGGSAAIYLALFIFIISAPAFAEKAIKDTLEYTFNNLGWIYILGASSLLLALLLAFSRFGNIRLGQPEDTPEYSFLSWMGMLFGAGIGVGLLYFGVNEPMTHFLASPFYENGHPTAAPDALRLTFLHWGLHPWALYCAAGLAMAYFQYRRGLPNRVSSCFEPMLGREGLKGPVAKIIDIFAIVATLCGVSTSAGFAATQFSAGFARQYGLPPGLYLVAVVIVLIGFLSTLSAMKGLEKGIKVISDLNMWLVLIMIAFMVIVGPLVFDLGLMLESIGSYFSKLVATSLFTDASGEVAKKVGFNWVGGWTVMYYAWWLAFAPFVGGFLADISKGRSIREFILACLFAPTVLCFIWFAFFGGTAMEWTLSGKITLETAQSMVSSSDESLFIFLSEAPIASLTIIITLCLSMTLIVTSVNSGTYVLAQRSRPGGAPDPPIGNRAFWGVFISLNALLFLWVGGMQALRNSSMVAALPFLFILILMIANTIRALLQEERGGKI
ncbi:MAG: BCCT family transporter [Candidatus Adiutrix sp.]|jgi:glycine betaine transporter|nr:BCCT family transporter [Candidatus Adiutrix sp.]